ncbi:MAG: methylmalonyl Co-A mutase-associated GTPase MeaB [Acidimicrobiia bacterium]
MSGLAELVREGDSRAVARLITLLEEGDPTGQKALADLFPHTGRAHVVGVTGAPGAGKSTISDQIIRLVRRSEQGIGVLAVDPTSPFSGGAILGDRVRMQDHASDPEVFIRSLASRGHLGGLSAVAPQAVAVLDAAGKPFVLVETVGVGQAEVEIVERADTIVVVVAAGWGDGIQAAKAGLLEIADVFIVNKADRPGADETISDLRQMLQLGSERPWTPPIIKAVATSGEGIAEAWDAVLAHREHLTSSGELNQRRAARLQSELNEALASEMRRAAAKKSGREMTSLTEDVLSRRVDPWTAARRSAETA